MLLLVAPVVGSQHAQRAWHLTDTRWRVGRGALCIHRGRSPISPSRPGASMHALTVVRATRTGAATLAVSAIAAIGVAIALRQEQLAIAFGLSCLCIALRAGVIPLHVGVASICDRLPFAQTQQLSSTIALVFVHLRFVDHHAAAIELAPLLVRYGAAATHHRRTDDAGAARPSRPVSRNHGDARRDADGRWSAPRASTTSPRRCSSRSPWGWRSGASVS